MEQAGEVVVEATIVVFQFVFTVMNTHFDIPSSGARSFRLLVVIAKLGAACLESGSSDDLHTDTTAGHSNRTA